MSVTRFDREILQRVQDIGRQLEVQTDSLADLTAAFRTLKESLQGFANSWPKTVSFFPENWMDVFYPNQIVWVRPASRYGLVTVVDVEENGKLKIEVRMGNTEEKRLFDPSELAPEGGGHAT